jgi:predicted phosphodiesterase
MFEIACLSTVSFEASTRLEYIGQVTGMPFSAMQILAIGDLHFKRTNLPQLDIVVEKILQLETPDIYVLLGDINDTNDVAYMDPYNRIVRFVESLCKRAPVYMLIGNHDRRNNADFLSGEHFFNAFKHWPGVVVVDSTFVTECRCTQSNERTLESQASDGVLLTFVPYVPPGRLIEALDVDPRWRQSRVVFAHQEIRGVVYNGQVSTVGDKWQPSFPLIVSGHIHDYSHEKNVLYTGSPIQHSFSEKEEKFVVLLTVEKETLSWKNIALDVPVKRVVRLTADNMDLSRVDVQPSSDVKVIVEGTRGDLHDIARQPAMKKLKEKGVVVAHRLVSSVPQLHSDGNFRSRLWAAVEGRIELTTLLNQLFVYDQKDRE